MNTICLIFGIIFLANSSTAQYSYVYEIRHENKPSRNDDFGEMSQYKYNSPSELPRTEASSREEPKTRDFSVKADVGPSLLSMLRNQIPEKNAESKESLWSSPPDSNNGKTSSLSLQSNTDSPTYARQPLPKSYINVNEVPIYADKYRTSAPKGYPIQESRSLREEPRIYEQRPVYTSYPSHSMESRAPTRSPQPQPQEKDEKMRTVHQIQTPNYRISLVSKPESIDKILPFLEQYQLSQKPFQSSQQSSQQSSRQSYSRPSQIDSLLSQGQSSSYRESAKPSVFSVEPDSRIIEPTRHTVSQIPESRPSSRPLSYSLYEEKERQQMRAQPMRQYSAELKSEPRPILDLPRQELPPQMQLLKGRPITQLPPPEPRSHSLMQSRPSYLARPQIESLPVTALYQTSAPDLAKSVPKYSRVEYASEEEAKREERRPIASYVEEPTVYRIVERQRPEKAEPMALIDLNQHLEKLREDPSAQKSFFEKVKSQSMEMSDRSRTKYRNDDQPLIASDPNYKSSPIPDEYKPFTQTRYFKTYV